MFDFLKNFTPAQIAGGVLAGGLILGGMPPTSVVFFNDHYQAETSSSSSESDVDVLPTVQHIGDAVGILDREDHPEASITAVAGSIERLIDKSLPTQTRPLHMPNDESCQRRGPKTGVRCARNHGKAVKKYPESGMDLKPGYGAEGNMEKQLKSTRNVEWAALTIDIRTWRCSQTKCNTSCNELNTCNSTCVIICINVIKLDDF
ncbi:hypothetical protein J6590_064363 [Homalodisca vitripennis]|nr:hypothetical protein J6590_064363 [Homalodisca vitripennis]